MSRKRDSSRCRNQANEPDRRATTGQRERPLGRRSYQRSDPVTGDAESCSVDMSPATDVGVRPVTDDRTHADPLYTGSVSASSRSRFSAWIAVENL